MSLLDRILKILGINPTRLRWKIHRFQERSKKEARSVENRSRSVTYKHKVCDNCGLTVDRDERRCPRCKERLSGHTIHRLKMLWRWVIPKGTYTYSTVFVTLNVAIFLVMVMRSGGIALVIKPFSLPLLIQFGACSVMHIVRGEIWRLITPIFLHMDLLHVLFNSIWLIHLGPMIEKTYGRSRFLALFLGSGVVGFMISTIYRWGTMSLTMGASGAIFGLIAAALVVGYIKRSPGAEIFREGLIKWAIFLLVMSFLPGTDMAAHLGGAAGGAGLAWILADTSQSRRLSDRWWLLLEIALLLLILASFLLVAIFQHS